MRSWIGTSGYQYPEWKGSFYPEDLSAAKMLAYYAARFPTTESNYSFRHIPSAKTIEKWAKGTPADFRFSLKAPQRVTHFARLKDCAETVEFFCGVARGLGGKLGAILYQLPPKFECDLERLRAFLQSLPRDVRAAFEFRHVSWFAEPVYALLREHCAALCLAEDDELVTPKVATADFGYLRLRRTEYSKRDLAAWAKFLKTQAGWQEAFVYFKHEEAGTGPKFGARLQELLRG